LKTVSPERQRIAKIFKANIERAIKEQGISYKVDLRGTFDKTPVRIEIEVSSEDEIL
jgi:hypothetical protein